MKKRDVSETLRKIENNKSFVVWVENYILYNQ